MTSTHRTEESDPFCLSRPEAAALLSGAPWRRFVVIGDSLSAGTGDPSPGYEDKGWPDRFADVLRRVQPDLEYLSTAVDGATTAQTLENQIGRALEFRPDLLHLPCGANDLVRRKPEFDEIEQRLRRMYELASQTGAQLTTFTLGKAYVIPVFPDWSERVSTVNDITRGLAAEYEAVVIDMWDHPVNSREDLLSADRIHFSTSGQAVMAAEMAKGLSRAISLNTRT
ncbi:SGNH/GDSL hydrolase family protein [Streptomyces sp. NPDC097595]|uniref:SGNH/GDSL hydrolase family protein n=1 Tax=Streptomyces sp. NPDC097595 TaxID=3366090 RepID=UPI00381F8F0F